jgi:phosphatidylinositol alpha 1,6-mannosyltransferase
MTTYVALGDSFTAGLVPGEPRWADEVARALGPDTRYENLAWVGATSSDVEHKQLDKALGLRPDVVTIVCGANDVLESVRPDADAYAQRLARMFARLRREAPDAEVVTATYPDISRFLDLRPRTRARVEKGMRRFNAACRSVARNHGVALLEGFDHPAASERGTYAEDGFHPSEEGHRRAAMEFLRALKGRFRPPREAPARQAPA